MSGLIDPTQTPPSRISLTADGLEAIVEGMKKEKRTEITLSELKLYIDRLRVVDELLKGGEDLTLEMLDRIRSNSHD